MRRYMFLLAAILYGSISVFSAPNVVRAQLDSVLRVLDATLDEKERYAEQKEQRIAGLRRLLAMPGITPEQRYDTNTRLFEEYKQYLPDSAIVFMLENVKLADQQGDRVQSDRARIHLALLYAVGGLYIEAADMLESVRATDLPPTLQVSYYDTYKQLFNVYPKNRDSARYYKQYRDSLLGCLDPASDNYKIVYAEKLTGSGQCREAREVLVPMFVQQHEDTHWRAVLAFSIGETYRVEGDYDRQKLYYALAAIGDVKNAIKENAALRFLGMAFYETGNVERAYRYVQQSLEDAVFSNARLRTMEVSEVFPVIEQAYQRQLSAQSERRFFLLICVGVLSLFLVAAVVYVYVQLRRITRFQRSLAAANKQLHDLNRSLQDTNKALSEANLLKETYISQFLDLCSLYIGKLEKYQHALNKKAMEHKLDELYKMLKSNDMIENEVKELYAVFDHVFLRLYPNFVAEFNSLLLPGERFELKSNELLNTELRIYALIRLGITDSSKIAAFLRYSATTIYNYRTRVRNKSAVPREEFESRVMRIGSVSR